MILRPFYLECLSHASYLIIDERSQTAAVIDPQRDIEQYLEESEDRGVRITHVLLTHFHADFVAGHLELRDRVGARVFLGARAQAEFEFTRLADGDVVELGDVSLSVLETPGHTPEGISLVLSDRSAPSSAPLAVFTGDTLFVGDVGRPDLMASIGITAEELAAQLYDSLHQKLMRLPDDTVVWPAHGAGSMCGKNLGTERSSTIGAQKAGNPALQPMSKEDFVHMVTEGQPAAPAYFLHDAMMNRSEHSTLEQNLEKVLQPLALAELRRLQESGAQVVDARDADSFAALHLKGSLNIGLGGKFASWAGTVLDRERPIVLIAEAGREEEAAMRLGRIGLDGVAGYLEGGILGVDASSDLLASVERRSVPFLDEQRTGEAAPFILDVRTPTEWGQGHIEGAVNLPLSTLSDHLAEVPADREVCVVCKGAYRSSVAASMLRRAGRESVHDLIGGMDAWADSGAAMVGDAPSCSSS